MAPTDGSTENVMEKRPQSTVDPGREIDLPNGCQNKAWILPNLHNLWQVDCQLSQTGVRDLRLKQRLIQAQLFNHVQ